MMNYQSITRLIRKTQSEQVKFSGCCLMTYLLILKLRILSLMMSNKLISFFLQPVAFVRCLLIKADVLCRNFSVRLQGAIATNIIDLMAIFCFSRCIILPHHQKQFLTQAWKIGLLHGNSCLGDCS